MNDVMVCSNIGRGQRRLRYISAGVFAGIAVVLGFILIATGAARWWRLLLTPLIWVGSYSYLEAVHRTCVALAARDEQSLEDKFVAARTMRGDKIQDDNLVKMLRQKARTITQQVIVITAAAMTILLLIP